MNDDWLPPILIVVLSVVHFKESILSGNVIEACMSIAAVSLFATWAIL